MKIDTTSIPKAMAWISRMHLLRSRRIEKKYEKNKERRKCQLTCDVSNSPTGIVEVGSDHCGERVTDRTDRGIFLFERISEMSANHNIRDVGPISHECRLSYVKLNEEIRFYHTYV